jgi:type IV secretion system protein VirB10
MTTEDDKARPYGPLPANPAQPSPVEQEQSAVASRQRLNNRQMGGIFIACVVGVGAVLLVNDLTSHHGPKVDKTAVATGGVGGRPFANYAASNETPAAPAQANALPLPQKHKGFTNPFMRSTQDSPAMKALNAPILAYSGQAGAPPQAAGQGGAVASASGTLAPTATSALGRRLNADQFSAADASLIAHPNYTIAAGTIIPCNLQTAINSGLPGFVKCVLPQPVRSMTGTVTLLDKGTQVLGEIRSGLVQGQDRLFILWTRAVTPQNVAITLASPAADALGRAGISGAINNHFLERFGAAIMLTIIGGSVQAASNAAQSGGGNNYFGSLSSNTNEVANTALQSTINIPPTLTRNQGANVSIFVARDLNFSTVYKLSLVNP